MQITLPGWRPYPGRVTSTAPAPKPRVPARAWLRPALMLLGGALAALLFVQVDQHLAALAIGVFSLFIASWTSPLRSGPHVPLAAAQARAREAAGKHVTIVLWAPGDPGSARLQAAIRSPREDLVWVNVFKDPAAHELLTRYGGERMLPLALQGEDAAHIDNVSELFAFQEAARRPGAPGDGAAPDFPADGEPGDPRP